MFKIAKPYIRTLLFVSSAILLPRMAIAAFDISATCTIQDDSVTVRTEAGLIELHKNASVRVTFGHFGHGYIPAYIKLPNEIGHVARSGLMPNEAGDEPRDIVRRTKHGAIWTHYPSEGSDENFDILLQCGKYTP